MLLVLFAESVEMTHKCTIFRELGSELSDAVEDKPACPGDVVSRIELIISDDFVQSLKSQVDAKARTSILQRLSLSHTSGHVEERKAEMSAEIVELFGKQ